MRLVRSGNQVVGEQVLVFGGEVWTAGSGYYIEWESCFCDGPLSFWMSEDGGPQWMAVEVEISPGCDWVWWGHDGKGETGCSSFRGDVPMEQTELVRESAGF